MWERTFPMALSPHPCFEFVPVVSSTHAYPSMEPESTKTCSTWRYLQLGLDVVLISKEFLTNMGIRQFRGVSSLFSLWQCFEIGNIGFQCILSISLYYLFIASWWAHCLHWCSNILPFSSSHLVPIHFLWSSPVSSHFPPLPFLVHPPFFHPRAPLFLCSVSSPSSFIMHHIIACSTLWVCLM